MYTRWHMTMVLFFSCIGIALLLHSALCLNKGGGKSRPLSSIASAIFSSVAILTVALSLNEPSKIIHLLAKPASGLSGALIGQLAVVGTAVFLYFKGAANRYLFVGLGTCVAIASAIALSRNYMVPSRPAVDTFLTYILLILIVVQAAGYFTAKEEEPQYRRIMLGLALAYGVSLLAFLFRLTTLAPEDRLFTFASMSSGQLAPLFWGVFLFSALLPALISAALLIRSDKVLPKVQQLSYAVGVFLFCWMLNLTPIIIKSIMNRPV